MTGAISRFAFLRSRKRKEGERYAHLSGDSFKALGHSRIARHRLRHSVRITHQLAAHSQHFHCFDLGQRVPHG
jgi:hypothetical protein